MRTPALAGNVGLSRTTAAGLSLLVLTVDLNDPNVKVTGVVAQHGNGTSEPFNSMIHRTHPTAAVTGTFFSMGSLTPIGDIVVDGKLVHRGGIGTGLCITEGNQCQFVHPPHCYCSMDWSNFDFVCCAGPRLVVEGNPTIHPRSEGFRDSHLLGYATRLAVGLTDGNKLLFVATRSAVPLSRLAKAMKKLGCTDAMALDAGSSLGFYKGGRMLISPNRRLTNAILIYDDKNRYERFKARLTPVRSVASKK